MQIDWLTVAAQIANFLLLVWLLQRFLYRPIIRAMRRREDRIVARLSDAAAARRNAEQEAARLKDERAALADCKADMLDEARAQAEALRARLEDDLRDEMARKRETWLQHLDEERDDILRALQRQAGRQVVEITERVIADFVGTDISDQMATRFIERLGKPRRGNRETLVATARRADGPARVESGPALEAAAKGRITRTLHETLSRDLEIEYRQDAHLVLGVRMILGEHSVEWSAARYLKRLETEFGEILDASGRPRAPAEDAARKSA